jgi:hypothetical protein
MTKFNKFDQHVIEEALKLWVADFENQINEVESQGKRSIYGINFPSMMAKEIQSKVDSLTKKK